jgi:hypothetical protein
VRKVRKCTGRERRGKVDWREEGKEGVTCAVNQRRKVWKRKKGIRLVGLCSVGKVCRSVGDEWCEGEGGWEGVVMEGAQEGRVHKRGEMEGGERRRCDRGEGGVKERRGSGMKE